MQKPLIATCRFDIEGESWHSVKMGLAEDDSMGGIESGWNDGMQRQWPQARCSATAVVGANGHGVTLIGGFRGEVTMGVGGRPTLSPEGAVAVSYLWNIVMLLLPTPLESDRVLLFFDVAILTLCCYCF